MSFTAPWVPSLNNLPVRGTQPIRTLRDLDIGPDSRKEEDVPWVRSTLSNIVGLEDEVKEKVVWDVLVNMWRLKVVGRPNAASEATEWTDYLRAWEVRDDAFRRSGRR